MTPIFELNHTRIMTMTTMLLITIGVAVAMLLFIAWYPFNPVDFSKGVVLTPEVRAGEVLRYEMRFVKHNNISPRIQRVLYNTKTKERDIIKIGYGESRIGENTKIIKALIPTNTDPGIYRMLNFMQYDYFGGLRVVSYWEWTDEFQVLPKEDLRAIQDRQDYRITAEEKGGAIRTKDIKDLKNQVNKQHDQRDRDMDKKVDKAVRKP